MDCTPWLWDDDIDSCGCGGYVWDVGGWFSHDVRHPSGWRVFALRNVSGGEERGAIAKGKEDREREKR